LNRIFLGTIAVLLLIGLFSSALNIQIVKAIGPVYIRADGSIDPPDAPIHRIGDLYILAGNIGFCDTDGIVIERDNMVLDGAGYAVQGYAGGVGVRLAERSNVTIENLQVTGFGYGVFIDSSFAICVHGNNITGSSYAGMYLLYSNHNNITMNNIVANYFWGITLDISSSNTLSHNNMTNNPYNLGVGGVNFSTYINSIDRTNTVNGRPVYYWINYTNMSVPPDAGYVALINCTEMTVQNLQLTHNYDGLLLVYTTNSLISGNTITDNYFGIELENSTGNTLTNNAMTYNEYNFDVNNFASHWAETLSNFINYVDTSNTVDGRPVYYWINQKNKSVPLDAGYVALVNCTGIMVKDVNITKNGSGVLLAFTTNSTVAQSRVGLSYRDIWLCSSTNNTISENNIFDAGGMSAGINLEQSSNNKIVGNNMTNLFSGFFAHVSSNNSIYNNNFINNPRQIRLCHGSSYNNIYHNNFINTVNQIYLLSAGVNFWDAGYPSGGNYWSDYSGVDEFRGVYQNETGSDGIGDSPRPLFINSSQEDFYPLMGPFGPSTTTGENVTVFPTENVGLIFENVAVAGSTTASETGTGPAPESGFKIEGKYIDISTTASYSGNITIRLTYDDTNMTQQEEESLQLMRWNETLQQWENITASVDTQNNVIYGETDHLSIFGVHSQLIHDLSIFSVHLAKTVIGQGYTLRIDVDVRNEGDFAEDFDVTLDLIGGDVSHLSIFGVHILEESTTTLSFDWNTAGFAKTTYSITAHVSQVPYEIDVSDNTYTDGTAKVTIPGDITGDFYVSIQDATQIGLYWMQTVPPAPANVDINGDGIISIKDATLVGLNWLKQA